ncbi:hypothetical protein [Duganella sp. BJB475]|uniref:hypothetical protein n=1 Tax=Duganella sp. BJB475 TaxID=2233914 RepID=UPI000E3437D7|nr:hypothetical protein [Duganella sp. BJB475]RFP19127.1 hypothetical protein D0T23_04915 [Duganella sp. BJB475]
MNQTEKQIGYDLMMAAINCGHTITEDVVTLQRVSTKPGCSLTQLRERVLAAHQSHAAAAVAAERERAARLALQWSNARHPDHGGNALRNYAQALRDGVQVSERDSDYHWSKAPAAQVAQTQPLLTQAQIDYIGEQWDGCMHDGPGMSIDIGEAIRCELAKLNQARAILIASMRDAQVTQDIGSDVEIVAYDQSGNSNHLYKNHNYRPGITSPLTVEPVPVLLNPKYKRVNLSICKTDAMLHLQIAEAESVEIAMQIVDALNAAENEGGGRDAATACADPVVEMNVALLRSRSELGIEKYGVTLADSRAPLRDWLEHALLEILDCANYMQTAMQRIDAAQSGEQEPAAKAGPDPLRAAVAAFIKAKGRFHTEQGYNALVAVFDAVDGETPP